jgi:hypothetical protein
MQLLGLAKQQQQEGLVEGEEVVYVGRELMRPLEPFASAVEIWVETPLLPLWGNLYLFSCRMPDGTWEMGQVGYGRDFRRKAKAAMRA